MQFLDRNPAEAAGFYRAALATRPMVGLVYRKLGRALFRGGQAAEAIAAHRRTQELDSRLGNWMSYDLDWYKLHNGKFDEVTAESAPRDRARTRSSHLP